MPARPTPAPLGRGPNVSRATAAGPEAWLRRETGKAVAKKALVGSSGWSSAYTYFMEDGTSFFVKESQGRGPAMFAGEAAGLRAMGAAGTSLKVPEVFEVGELDRGPPGSGGGSFIVMEHLEMSGRTDQAALGRALAEMHLAEPTAPEAKAGQFGFPVSTCSRRAERSGGLTKKRSTTPSAGPRSRTRGRTIGWSSSGTTGSATSSNSRATSG